MKPYSIFSSTGQLVRTGYCSPETFDLQAGQGETIREGTTEFPQTAPELSNIGKRLREYPPVGDQLDAFWHAMDAGTFPKIEPFFTQIKSVKDKYPKK